MATIRNVSRRALEFPSGAFIDVGGASDAIPDGDMKHPVVKGWVADGSIEVGKPKAPAAPPPPPPGGDGKDK